MSEPRIPTPPKTDNLEVSPVPLPIIQALADLGYPKEIRSTLKIDEIDHILTNNITYKKEDMSVIEKNENKEEVKETSESSVSKFEFKSSPRIQAAHELNMSALRDLIHNPKDVDEKDERGETLLHHVVMMAYEDFAKAEEIIEFLKDKGANIYIQDKSGMSVLDVAEKRAGVSLGYQNIVKALTK